MEELNKIPKFMIEDSYTQEIDNQFTDVTTQLAQTTHGSFIQEDDVSKIKALIENNKTIKMAILGDSTKAGVGWRFGDPDHGYAELADIDKPSSPEIMILNMLKSSPFFIKPSAELGGKTSFSKKGVSTSYTTGTSLNWDRYVLTYGVANRPTQEVLTFKHLSTKKDKMTVYYLQRYSEAAASADIVCNGVTTTISSYRPPMSFGSITGMLPQGYGIGTVEITIPTNADTFTVTINNIRAKTGSVEPAGTISIIGFYYGEPILLKNLAIRTTTLKNDTPRNQSKGITTNERFSKAFEFGANVFYIGWGTNDAYEKYSVVEFGNELRTRIDEIRTQVPGAVIIIDSVYSTSINPTVDTRNHFAEAKKVALEKKCSFLDADNILRKFTHSEVINDYVHQNEYGYRVIGESMCNLFGIPNSKLADEKVNKEFIPESPQLTPVSGTWTPVLKGGGTTDVSSYGYQYGSYYKIDKLVVLNCSIRVLTKGTLTGALTITGLPFPAKSITNYTAIGSMEYSNFVKGADVDYIPRIRNGSSVINIRKLNNSALAGDAVATDIIDETFIFISIQYETD